METFLVLLQYQSVDSHIVRLVDGIQNFIVIALVGHKIQIVGVKDENAHIGLLLDKVEVTLLQMFQVGVVNRLLVIASALVNIALQMLHVKVQIHHQLRLGNI